SGSARPWSRRRSHLAGASASSAHARRITPTIGRQTGYAAALAEANGPEQGLAVLDALDRDTVSSYQPYWAVRAHLLQRLGRTREASDAYDRAIGLAEDPTIKEFLLRRRG